MEINLITLVITVFGFAMMIFSSRRLRQESRATKRAPLIAIATTVIVTFLYVVLSNTKLRFELGMYAFLIGAVLGLIQGRASKLFWRGEVKVIKRSTLYLIIWALGYVISSLLSLTGSQVYLGIGILILLFGTGLAFTSNFVLLLRQLFMRRPKQKPAPNVPPAA